MEQISITGAATTEDSLSIALVDQDGQLVHELEKLLQRLGIVTRHCSRLPKMVETLKDDPPDFLMVGIGSPDALDLKLIKAIAATHADIRLIALLAPELSSYDELLRQAGVQMVVSRSLTPRQVADVLATHAELRQLELQNYRLRQMLDGRSSYENLVGGSLPMRALYRLLDQISRTDSPVLVTGEEGTERIDVAKAIHLKSERTHQPVTIVDCRTAKDDPEAASIFGPRGVGAHGTGPCPRTSAFAKAGKGTIVLHRIEALHLDAQRRLLHFMHRPFFQNETPGTPQPLSRIIATSGPDLLAQVEEGKFLRELFYRLNILQVRVPALRERREDIPMLAQYYLRCLESEKGSRNGGRGLSLTSRALLHLFQHDWQGNLEELRDLVDQLVRQCRGLEIDVTDLPETLRAKADAPAELQPVNFADRSLKDAKHWFESEYFKGLLKKTGGNMTLASRLSRVGRPYLYKKIREYDINPDQFR